MSHMVEKLDAPEGWSCQIYYDEDQQDSNPRDQDNIGTMVCFHRRYTLGDTHPYKAENYEGWEAIKDAIEEDEGPLALCHPLYLMDHSGLALSMGAFNCPWDSGQVGWIYVTAAAVHHNWGTAIDAFEKAESCLRAEVDAYSMWLNGEVYGYVIRDPLGEDQGSGWGCLGIEYAREAAQAGLQEAVSAYARREMEVETLIQRGFAL